MGVYISNMEMPMYWYECPFCSDGYCFMIQDGDDRICLVNSKEDTHRNENCPLIELPPHGRLVDADALMLHILDYIEEYDDDLSDNGYHNGKWCAMKEAKMVIDNAPTIIEAEGEEI